MASGNRLSELEERVLLALWKLRGVGKNHIKEDVLRADLTSTGSASNWTNEISSLHSLSLLQIDTVGNEREISLTPFGLSLIRQIEEDKLQELK